MSVPKYIVKKGDTLNDIANAHGFKNYKDAGINSVPSGNFDLIHEGDVIEFNGSSSNSGQIEQPPALVSSLDSQQQFNKDSSTLDEIMNPVAFDADTGEELDTTATDNNSEGTGS